MENKTKKGLEIIKSLVIGLLSVILVLNLYVIIQSKLNPNKVPSIFGYKPFIVLSNSMQDEFVVGDLIVVKSVNFESLKTGDVVAFRDDNNKVTTHRIVNMLEKGYATCFETKGDNNNTNDEGMVCEESVEGKYIFKIPLLGEIILFIQEPYGFIIILLILIIVFLLIKNRNDKEDAKINDEKEELEEYRKDKNKKEVKKTSKKEEVKK